MYGKLALKKRIELESSQFLLITDGNGREVVLVGTRGAAAIAREERENTHQLMNGTAGRYPLQT